MTMIGCWEYIVVEICHWCASSRLFILKKKFTNPGLQQIRHHSSVCRCGLAAFNCTDLGTGLKHGKGLKKGPTCTIHPPKFSGSTPPGENRICAHA